MQKFERRIVTDQDGKIKRCPRTIASKGYWWTLWNCYGWWKDIKKYWISAFYEAMIEPFLKVALFIFVVVTTPVAPFIKAYKSWKNAVKICVAEDKRKGVIE